jgi:hypothetical protein
MQKISARSFADVKCSIELNGIFLRDMGLSMGTPISGVDFRGHYYVKRVSALHLPNSITSKNVHTKHNELSIA